MPEFFTLPVAEAVARWLHFTGLALLIGASVASACIVGIDPPTASEHRDKIHTFGQRAATVALLALALRLVQQSLAFADTPEVWAESLQTILTDSIWGIGWMIGATGLFFATLFVGVISSSLRERPVGWTVFGVALAVACLGPALTGHAIGSERLTIQAVVADWLHVAAAGTWLGTLAALIGTSFATPDALKALHRFSPIALTSAAVLGATGSFAAWLHVQSLAFVWSSSYGKLLLLKVALVAAMAAFGAYNWRVLTPRLRAAPGTVPLVRSAVAETMVGLVVLMVTAVLVATALPGEG